MLVNDDAEELEDYHGFADLSEGVSNEGLGHISCATISFFLDILFVLCLTMLALYMQMLLGKKKFGGHSHEVQARDGARISRCGFMATMPRKDGKRMVSRLTGRLGKQSAKLHPCMPSVTTGQVYKLWNPSGRYLASYNSSDPTKVLLN